MNDIPIHLDNNGRVIDENMSCIEKILHSKKLNYQDLTIISDPYLKDNKKETINIFIDLFDIFKQMYSPNLQEEIKTIRSKNKLAILAELINTVAHYRHFFVSRYDKYCTVVMYYSDEKDLFLTSIDKDYKKSFYNKRLLASNNKEFYVLNKVIKDCLFLLNEYLLYIPHAYLINTKKTEPQALFQNIKSLYSEDPYLKDKINIEDDFNIIMSNNDLALLNLIDNDNTIIFKNNGREGSKFINKCDIWDILNLDNSIGLNNELLYLLFAMSGNKHYDISNLPKVGIKKAFNMIAKLQKDGKDLKGIINNNEKIKEYFSKYDYDLIIKNLKLINYNNYPLTNNNNKVSLIEQFNDISNFEYIKQETFHTFNASNVVLLNYLFDGEVIE